MIYIAPALQLAPYNVQPNTPRIGWRTIITAANIAADEEEASHPAANLANPRTDARAQWWGETTAEQFVTIAQAASNVDYFAIARHNLGSSGSTVQLQGSANNVDWVDVSLEVSPGNDYVLMAVFEPVSYSYWRLRIVPGSAAPRIAVLYVGQVLSMQRTLYVGHTPLPYGRQWSVGTGLAEDGEFLGRVLRHQTLGSEAKFQHLTPQWYRQYLDPLYDDGIATPFFWAWRPGDYPEEVGYAWFTGPPAVSNQLSNGMMETSFSMKGIR